MDVYVESPLTKEFTEELTCILEASSGGMENTKWTPKSVVGHVINLILIAIFNNNQDPFLKNLKDHCPKDIEYLETLVKDMREQILDTFENLAIPAIEFRVTDLEIIEGLIKLKVDEFYEL